MTRERERERERERGGAGRERVGKRNTFTESHCESVFNISGHFLPQHIRES